MSSYHGNRAEKDRTVLRSLTIRAQESRQREVVADSGAPEHLGKNIAHPYYRETISEKSGKLADGRNVRSRERGVVAFTVGYVRPLGCKACHLQSLRSKVVS